MKIFADESVDRQIVERLRVDGHEVLYVAELEPGIDDEAVLSRSLSSQAILITADKDFGELIFRKGLPHSGVLLVRFEGLPPDLKASLTAAAIGRHGRELSDAFGVLTQHMLRLRRLPRS